MKENEALTLYTAAFVHELTRANVKHVVISPGSRSTPLAMVMAEHPSIKVWVNIDERSAGFFALGMAKASKEVVALLCTSGTAAANYYPAIVEAKQSRVPLIVLTADRPHELRDVGAPQAINQIGMFASYPKWFAEMALPESKAEVLNYVKYTAVRASAIASAKPAGPVHLNFPFREPLVPNLQLARQQWEQEANEEKTSSVAHSYRTLQPQEYDAIASSLQSVEEGLIICGPHEDEMVVNEIEKLSKTLKFPIIADPLSPMRYGEHSKELVIDSYDAFLRDEHVTHSLKPKVMIRFGAMPISKALTLFIKKHGDCKQMIVDEGEGWRDPTLLVNTMIYSDIKPFCEEIYNRLSEIEQETNWSKKWRHLNNLAQPIVYETGQTSDYFEGKVFSELHELLPNNAALFVGNSMPVRDLDTFFHNTNKKLTVLANRGANGIDGVVSSAIGAATVHDHLVLIIGDLSFFHDLNGLLAAKVNNINISIVVINNNGGGIFSYLPQAKEPTHFDMLFNTPTDLKFEPVVNMYGGQYTKIEDWPHFRETISTSFQTGGFHVLELFTDRKQNVNKHKEMWSKVSEHIHRGEGL